MAKTENLERLVARLRDMEAEALRLGEMDFEVADRTKHQTYRDRLNQLENSHSHSWFGDHATTYFDGFQPPPGGRTFDVEWGFVPGFEGSNNPGWQPYSREELRAFIFADLGEEVSDTANEMANEIYEQFSNLRDQSADVLEILSTEASTKAIQRYTDAVKNEINPFSVTDYVNNCAKRTPNMTRDSEELAKGKIVPIHVQLLAPFKSLDANRRRLRELANMLRNAIEAVQLTYEFASSPAQTNTIFIGHGRSEQWRILKDFLKERLGLSIDEYNRVPAAGISTQERLSEMLEHCGFAFLVFTGEDTHTDESLHARENVIHESGLFQGRLGWRRAIVLLENGCDEFSNIVGLGQIRFAEGNIGSCFEDIRRVLEREGILGE